MPIIFQFSAPHLPPPIVVITTVSLPNATVNVAYSVQLTATGGVAPYTWTLTSDSGSGLSLSAGGVLSGTPGSPGTFSLVVQATDSMSQPSAPANFSLTIGGLPPAPRFTFFSLTNSVFGSTASTGVPRLGRADLVVLGDNEGVGTFVNSAYGSNMNGLATHIQNQGNGAGNTIVVQYFLPDTHGTDPLSAPSYPQWKTIIEANNWDVYNLGTSGTKTPNYFNASWTMANSTTNVPLATTPSWAVGLSMEETAAQFFYRYDILGTQGGANQAGDKMPTLNGLWHDNTLLGVPKSADWLRTGLGTQNFGGSADASYRAGLTLGFTWLKNNAPTLLRLGNIANWGAAGIYTLGSNTLGGLDGLLNGGLQELLLGAQFGVEQFSTFANTKSMYQFAMAHTSPNAITHVKAVMPGLYWDSNGRDYLTNNTAPWNANPNWQAARYQICFALQDDGWPAINNFPGGDYNSSHINWLDELTVNPTTFAATGEANSTTGKGYMGQRSSAPWNLLGQGVYGTTYLDSQGRTWVAFLNPKSNGSQTFNIATYFPGKRLQLINGTQAAVNSGAIVTSLTLVDRDGRIGCLVV